jgi:hypothetical protein
MSPGFVDDAQLKFRISKSLRRKIERAAKQREATLNDEIRVRLEASLEDPHYRSLQETAEAIQKAWLELAGTQELIGWGDLMALTLLDARPDKLEPAVIHALKQYARGWLADRPALKGLPLIDRAKEGSQ